MRSGKWETFEDFLFDYLKSVFGREWYEAELTKSSQDRHPLLRWFDEVSISRQGATGPPGAVHTQIMTPALAQVLWLAYNLFLLAHNATLQAHLVVRLKHIDQFDGALYETYVAAWCVLSGLKVELERESDPTKTHCEFTAISPFSGRKYSVEAKARKPGRRDLNVRRKIELALAKEADHERIVFVEVAIDSATFPMQHIVEELSGQLRELESQSKVRPAAYVVFTNQPFEFDENGHPIGRFALVEGFRMPDWGGSKVSVGVLEAFKTKQRHLDVFRVGEFFDRYSVPSTFDGESPDIAFGDAPTRLVIGDAVEIELPDGTSVGGEMTAGCVDESNSSATIALWKTTGESAIVTVPLSPEELAAYRQHPKTFFGDMCGSGRGQLRGPLDFFEFLHRTYSKIDRDRLLEFMKSAPDIEHLRTLSQDDLAMAYCERIVNSEVASGRIRPSDGSSGFGGFPARPTG